MIIRHIICVYALVTIQYFLNKHILLLLVKKKRTIKKFFKKKERKENPFDSHVERCQTEIREEM